MTELQRLRISQRSYRIRGPDSSGRDESGVTLIEAMAGMIVLSLGLLALLPLATLSIEGNQIARDTGDVIGILQNRIEHLRNDTLLAPGSEVDPNNGMTTNWWVDNDPSGLKKLSVEVTWQDDAGVAHRQKAITYQYRKP